MIQEYVSPTIVDHDVLLSLFQERLCCFTHTLAFGSSDSLSYMTHQSIFIVLTDVANCPDL